MIGFKFADEAASEFNSEAVFFVATVVQQTLLYYYLVENK